MGVFSQKMHDFHITCMKEAVIFYKFIQTKLNSDWYKNNLYTRFYMLYNTKLLKKKKT